MLSAEVSRTTLTIDDLRTASRNIFVWARIVTVSKNRESNTLNLHGAAQGVIEAVFCETGKSCGADYPLEALREIIANAFIHADHSAFKPILIFRYEDRVEIDSPGGLFGCVTPENIERATDYRNPFLADAMAELNHARKLGIGLARARVALSENGNPPAEFRIASTNVVVTVRKKKPLELTQCP